MKSGNRVYGNGDINFYINSYMNVSQKAELYVSIRHVERLSTSRIPIYTSEDPDMAGRKMRRRKQAFARHYAFHANVTISNTNNKAFFFFK